MFLLILLGTIEGTAWLADSIWEFRRRLLVGYRQQAIDHQLQPTSSAQPAASPFTSPADLHNDDPRLFVRPHRDLPGTGGELVVGGRVIPDARHATEQEPLSADAEIATSGKQVFILGGSAAYGYPYNESDSLSGELRRLLNRPRAAGSRIEFSATRVHNTAYPGWNSHDLVPIANKIAADFQPDVVIVFAGNNEWVHWRTSTCLRPGDNTNPTKPKQFVPSDAPTTNGARHVLTRLAHSRSLSAVQYLVFRWQRRQSLDSARDAHLAKFESTFRLHVELTGSTYALKHPEDLRRFDPQLWHNAKRRYLDEFRRNLIAIARTLKNSRVVLVTVPFNYRLAPAWNHRQPLASDTDQEASIRRAIALANTLIGDSQPGRALATLQAAEHPDCESPVLHYLKGECLVGLNRPDEAENAFAVCREQMVGHLGGRLSINREIRRASEDAGCELLDARELFDRVQAELGGHFNRDLIHDDCHPTPLGHHHLAIAIRDLLVSATH